MMYVVGGQGWWIDIPPKFIPAGTLIDDSLKRWSDAARVGPPPDAVPLDWPTYWYMTSNGVPGKGYSMYKVDTRLLGPRPPFILGDTPLGDSNRALG